MKTLNIKKKRYIITKSLNHSVCFFFFLNNFSYNIYILRFFYQKKKRKEKEKVNSAFLSMNFEMKTNVERINTGTFKLI